MNNSTNNRITSIGLVWLAAAVSLVAQQHYTVDKTSAVTVDGTSTLHNFSIASKSITGNIMVEPNGTGVTVNSIAITIPVKTLQSGKDGMDEKMYETLNADEHPYITFESAGSGAMVMNPTGTGSLNATGTLTINGVPKSITMKVEGKRIEGKKYLFEGSQTLLMSDFGIDPPTMFFGTVSTGDAVTVHFSVVADPSAAEANAGM